ncbi:MAG: hypothetical protein JWQ83_72 [Lacunisphaera sp.]|nr:hypothetical protein [Lacunisphaera sp.]MDB6164932.1 hypothetical protein [Lacunisphaera sp.]
MKSKFPVILFTLAALAGTTPAFACSVCGCSLSSDWAAQGYATLPGLETGLRYEYFEQSELRSGPDRVDRNALAFPNDDEIQQRTLNRNVWLDLNYVIAPAWALAVSVPWHDRFHTTIAEGDTDISTSQARGLGDVRLVARYQKSGAARSFGLQFGLKLPTGRFDQDFSGGPQTGELLDRGLQLGTGTTNLLAGASWFARPATAWGVFVQAQLDQPLAARAGFVPSSSVTVSGGVRWLNSSRLTPELQLNLKAEGREHGALADTANSGGTLAYLSPGVTAELTARCRGFAFVQLPVYQRVNGLQLEPRWLLAVGVRWKH